MFLQLSNAQNLIMENGLKAENILASDEIKWFVNGVEMPELANLTAVPVSYFSSWDEWYFLVRSFDGLNYSNWSKSNVITIMPEPQNKTENKNVNKYAVAVIAPDEINEIYSDVERGIIYSVFDSYSKGLDKNPVSIEPNAKDFTNLRYWLSNYHMDLSLDDIAQWWENFKYELIENVELSNEDIKKYGLTLAKINYIVPFEVAPKNIESSWIYRPCLGGERAFKIMSNSSKPINNCEVVNGVFKCKQLTDTTTQVIYNITSDKWFSNTWNGKLKYVSNAGEETYQNIKLRGINICYSSAFTLGISFYIFVSLIIAMILGIAGYFIIKRTR
jgi:hypothetical protein